MSMVRSRRRGWLWSPGASSGLGAAFAERLAGDGYDLIITARRKERLEALKERLAGSDRRIEILAADLSDGAGLQAVVDRIRSEPALEMLVNNAGFAGYMPFIQLAPERARELVNLQVMAVVQLTHAALPGMIARARGSIINVLLAPCLQRVSGFPKFPQTRQSMPRARPLSTPLPNYCIANWRAPASGCRRGARVW